MSFWSCEIFFFDIFVPCSDLHTEFIISKREKYLKFYGCYW